MRVRGLVCCTLPWSGNVRCFFGCFSDLASFTPCFNALAWVAIVHVLAGHPKIPYSKIAHQPSTLVQSQSKGTRRAKGCGFRRRTTLVRSPVIQLTRTQPRTDRFGPSVFGVHKPVCFRRTKHLAHRDTFWNVYYSSRPSHGSRCAIRKRVGGEMPDRGEDSSAVAAGGRVSKGEQRAMGESCWCVDDG